MPPIFTDPDKPIFPPTFKFFPIPTPPSTTNAPVLVLVDCAVPPIYAVPPTTILSIIIFLIVAVPSTVTFPHIPASPPILIFFAIPTPPATINAPL